ncbi:MAG: hypothetical protein K1X83_05005 [Oligoflexia bacterium]|nr:hypothetical protein [Oligoflexia bacterium]
MYLDRAKIIGLLPRLLGPIVGLCLRYSIKLDELVEALKYILIQRADSEISLDSAALSAARISAITGVHRKDIARLRASARPSTKPKNLVMKILGQWEQDRRFCRGRTPKPLKVDGKRSEFTELVYSVSTDLNPYAVLFELQRIGAVECKHQVVRLVTRSHSTRADFEQGLEQLADDLQNLIIAVQENLSSQAEVPNHHLSTEYDNIPAQCADKIRRLLFQEGRRLHRKMRSLLAPFDRDVGSSRQGDGRLRVVFGSYSCLVPHKPERRES